MGRNLQDGERLRPVDLARGHGLSTQAIRNYEAAGILPGAGRTPHGYRTYTPLHALALRAFLALVPGHGHQTATAVMQAVHRDATEDALRLIDESHAQLLDDRRTLQAVEAALRDLDPVPRGRGDLLQQVAAVIAQVHAAGGVAPLESMLGDWHARLSARSRAMLAGAAALDAYLGARVTPSAGTP